MSKVVFASISSIGEGDDASMEGFAAIVMRVAVDGSNLSHAPNTAYTATLTCGAALPCSSKRSVEDMGDIKSPPFP